MLAGHHRLEKERVNARLEVIDEPLDEVHQVHAELRQLTTAAASAARAEIGKAQAEIAREAAQQIAAAAAAQQLTLMTRTSWLRAVQVETEQHAAADLVIGRVHRNVLRYGVNVAEAAFERVLRVNSLCRRRRCTSGRPPASPPEPAPATSARGHPRRAASISVASGRSVSSAATRRS
ncbi:MAG TPA: hypothetical protein VMF86_14120 [Stellaceae bacterium]|nr:hypothetical protein [Stellaceae bacterium]